MVCSDAVKRETAQERSALCISFSWYSEGVYVCVCVNACQREEEEEEVHDCRVSRSRAGLITDCMETARSCQPSRRRGKKGREERDAVCLVMARGENRESPRFHISVDVSHLHRFPYLVL